jgi:cytochrome P450
MTRRALEPDTLPLGHTTAGGVQDAKVKIIKGSDFFLSIWNLHRSPLLWDKPDEFDPERWRRPTPAHLVETFNAQRPAGEARWEGYSPQLDKALYPNEQHADYAFLPFGAGPVSCVEPKR